MFREMATRETDLRLTDSEWKVVETEIRYEGYLLQQRRQVEQLRRLEDKRIPSDLSYRTIPGLSREIVEKMTRVRPETLGQAGRIPGVTPAALAILNVYLARQAQ
jgi:tRNA uridine 5-carboxymethylaminomethyl modification enzyme